MNNKTTSRSFACLVAFACGAALPGARAQQAPVPLPPAARPAQSAAPTPTDLHYGLLGESYTGLRFTYVDHSDSPPRSLRRYGFVSNANYARGVDTAFNYDFREGGAAGGNYQWNNLGAAITGFVPDLGAVRPFATGQVGWRWRKIGAAREHGFAYLLAGGVEIEAGPGVAVAPYASYQAAPRLHEHRWFYGANATCRFSRAWSALLGAEVDDRGNTGYTFGANRHF